MKNVVASALGTKVGAELGNKLLAVILYICIYHGLYILYVSQMYEYLGFRFVSPSPIFVVADTIAAVLPALFLPTRMERPSLVIVWTLYVAVYIPSIYVPLYSHVSGYGDHVSLVVIFCLSFTSLTQLYRLRPLRISLPEVPTTVFWSSFWVVYVALLGAVVYVYWGNFRLVSFNLIYENIRFTGGALSEGTPARYGVLILGGALNPLLVAIGLVEKRWRLFALGCLGELVLYSTAGERNFVVLPIILVAIYLAMTRFSGLFRAHHLILGVTGIAGILLGGFLVLGEDNMENIWGVLCSLFLMRTLVVPGINTALYQDYFADHPKTYYSHINVLKSFLGYPYEKSIGETVGYFYTQSAELNSNAHAWATDGIAALGIGGIVPVTIGIAVLLLIIDSVSHNKRPELVMLVCIGPAMNLANVSLFTSLLSGGILLLIVLLAFMPSAAPRGPSDWAQGTGGSHRAWRAVRRPKDR